MLVFLLENSIYGHHTIRGGDADLAANPISYLRSHAKERDVSERMKSGKVGKNDFFFLLVYCVTVQIWALVRAPFFLNLPNMFLCCLNLFGFSFFVR